MKILLVSLNYWPEQTGIGKFQGEMAQWFAARGHEVRVVSAPPYYPAWKVGEGYSACRYAKETVNGVSIQRVPLYVPSAPSGLKRLIHMASFGAFSFPVIVWQAMRWKADAVLLAEPPLCAAPAVLLACRLSGARSHLHVQDFEVDAAFQLGLLKHPFLYRLALKFERALMRGFSKISTISPRMRERLINKGIPEDRAFLVPNWAGNTDFDPAKGPGPWQRELKPEPGTVLAVYSGNLGNKQGLETIVDAAVQLRTKPHIRFIICGEGAARDALTARAKGLTNVVFLPVQSMENFVHLMIAADIHLLPQRPEAADLVMPSKLGNILASGRPVVAGSAPGTQVHDAVQGCGIAVMPDDAAAFAQAILTLADDPAMRMKMGEEGRKRAAAEWSRDGILERLEALLAD